MVKVCCKGCDKSIYSGSVFQKKRRHRNDAGKLKYHGYCRKCTKIKEKQFFGEPQIDYVEHWIQKLKQEGY